MEFFTRPYSNKVSSFSEIVDSIKRTPSGTRLLKSFLPAYRNGKICLAWTDEDTQFRLEPSGKRIYLNQDLELGIAIPVLAHEISHAIDEEWESSFYRSAQLSLQLRRKRRNPAEYDYLYRRWTLLEKTRLLETETRAYDVSFKIIRELRLRSWRYWRYVAAKKSDSRILRAPISMEEIAFAYLKERPSKISV